MPYIWDSCCIFQDKACASEILQIFFKIKQRVIEGTKVRDFEKES
ncbi:hypothetical protein HMPREF9078_00595 [Capnocytophaga sp. oral taxon 380 str. F0488]|nr:hypothetical protein HMPREF9078_00595 [Capnocytophaga sp. oral taxon 380 str. F0488]